MWKRPTINIYLISMNMVLLGLLFPTFSALFLREMVHLRDIQLERNINTIRQSMATRSASLVRSTALSAKEAIAGYDFTFLQNLLVEVTHDDPEIRSCLIVDQDQTVIAHSDHSLIGSALGQSPVDTGLEDQMRMKFPASMPPDSKHQVHFYWPGREAKASHKSMAAVFPIYSGQAFWGIIRCDYSLNAMEGQISQARAEWAAQLGQMRRYFLYLLGGFLLAGFAIAILLTRPFVRVTQVLHTGVQQVADGALDRELTLEGGIVCSEFAGLVSSFNIMTEKLRISHQQLDEYSKSLEEKVVERTKALHEAQGIMLKQAHEAGLAEMAVGVLHNIGNAITPAQVAATTLARHLAASPLRSRLEKSFVSLREFLEDKRLLSGQERNRLAQLLTHLPASIVEEFDWAIRELHDISAKHHHIENIIKLQMRYARVVEDPGQVDITHLAHDAINMLADAIHKRQITLLLNLQETLPVRAEESKLLQVLVNLIKNAYESMDACSDGERELIVTTSVRDGEPPFVLFSVEDRGCGFSEEGKKQLFAFGYSTKERGSGFGLHTCANTIIACHGSIEAESAGPGLGAKFTVLLPADEQT